jgi:hypothetical protein
MFGKRSATNKIFMYTSYESDCWDYLDPTL